MLKSTIDKDELIRQLLADRDRLFQENSRLRTAQNIAPEKAQLIYNEQLAAKDTLINKKEALLEKKDVRIAQLEKQVNYLKRQLYGGGKQSVTSILILKHDSWNFLRALTYCPEKRKRLSKPKRK